MNATVLIVGAKPGQEENLSGESFTGKSSKLLDLILADAGFDSATVRLTYAVRCVTPDRPPTPTEIATCRRYLIEEIAAIKPAVLVALGDIALRALTGATGIKNKRGQPLPLHKDFGTVLDVWPTYDPSLVFRTPMMRNTITSDLRRVRDRAIPQTDIPWKHLTSFSAVVAYDIETYDVDGAITDQPTQIAVATDHGTSVASGQDTLTDIARLRNVEPNETIIVSHNGWQFDDPKTGIQSHYDTMAMAYLLDETQPLGLESLCVKYLGVRGWKDGHAAKLGTDELRMYNARDAVYTLQLFYKLRELLGDRIKVLDHIIRPARFALDAASARGVWINGEEVEKARASTQALLDERAATVLAAIKATGFPEDFFDKQLKTKIKHVPFNINSNDHIGNLFTWLGFALPLTKEGDPQVGKDVLIYLDHPVARALLEYREVAKRMSTYIKPYAQIAATGDGRAHNIYKLTNTLTGRSTASDPNVQNLDRELKVFMDAPPGKCLTSADYSAMEFRMGAFVANETTIIENFRRNPAWDPHTWFAARLYGFPEEEITKTSHERQEAKSANFSQLYLGTGGTIKSYMAREMGMFITRERGDQIHRAWHQAFPGWVAYYGHTKELFLTQGYVESLTGRRRNFGDITFLDYHTRLAALRELVNAQIQGFCADIAFIALGACHDAGLPLNCFIHDDIKFEFDSLEQAQQAEPLIRQCMIDEPLRVLREVFGVVPTVPLEIEITHHVHVLTTAV